MKKLKTNIKYDKLYYRDRFNNIGHLKEISGEWTGARPKKILESSITSRRYLFKMPKYGTVETEIEVFNSILANELGLNHVQYFRGNYKGDKGVFCESFIKPNGKEELWEMKDLICRYSKEPSLSEKLGRNIEVKREHNIDNIYMIIETEFSSKINFHNFFKMIGFDALIGHGDRHWENYGFIVYFDEEIKTRFSPIYDTASGYLLEIIDSDLDSYFERIKTTEWHRPPNKPKLCKISVPNMPKSNHFDLMEYILESNEFLAYRGSLAYVFKQYSGKMVSMILNKFFPNLDEKRKNIIKIILEHRYKIGKEILESY